MRNEMQFIIYFMLYFTLFIDLEALQAKEKEIIILREKREKLIEKEKELSSKLKGTLIQHKIHFVYPFMTTVEVPWSQRLSSLLFFNLSFVVIVFFLCMYLLLSIRKKASGAKRRKTEFLLKGYRW